MPVASRIIRSAIYIESLVTGTVTPAVASKPATLRSRGNPTISYHFKIPTPPASPISTSKKPVKCLPDLPPFDEPPYNPALISPTLAFSLEQAKNHLIKADTRFKQLFTSLPCEPFERLEPVDPFRALITAVIGQHISQIAAKAAYRRFLQLFNRSLPEEVTPTHEQEYTFPSPGRVASLDKNILKTTGITERKAESMLDIAKRFENGELSAEKLVNASDKQVEEMLTAIRGIGKATADIFAITTLRQPDVLPVNSPKIHVGLLRWVLSSHEPENYPLYINPEKLSKPNKDTKHPSGVLLVPTSPVQLPEGVTLDTLKARANEEKASNGQFWSRNEMEALTTSWKPYRSLGVFYLGTLVGNAK